MRPGRLAQRSQPPWHWSRSREYLPWKCTKPWPKKTLNENIQSQSRRATSEGEIGFYLTRGHLALVSQIGLVAQHDEGELLRVTGSGVGNELVHPALQTVKGLGLSHIMHKHTGVRTTVERHTQTLKSLLQGVIFGAGIVEFFVLFVL